MSAPCPARLDRRAAPRQTSEPVHRSRNRRSRPGPAERAWRTFSELLRCSSGASAVEFAILAPFLVLGAFGTADAGRAIYQRMMIGQSLRAAAQLAMVGAEEDAVRSVFQEVASENFTIAPDGTTEGAALAIEVQSYCACPGQSFVQVGCMTICSSGLDATRFVRLFAGKTFDGIILPDFPISGAMHVMVQ